MYDVSDVPTCPVELRPGFTCAAGVIVTAPFPICTEHAAELYYFMHKSISWDGQLASTAVTPVVPSRGEPVVYYLALTNYIKIGWSKNLTRRLNMYTVDCRLLATEPGSMILEKRRHSEFGHLRVSSREKGNPNRREIFFPAVELIEHVNVLRQGQGYAPITTPSLATRVRA